MLHVTGGMHTWVLHDWLSLEGPEHPAPQTLGLGLLQVRLRLLEPPPQEAEHPDHPDHPDQPPLTGVQEHGVFTPPPS